jgi:hypothetical protein
MFKMMTIVFGFVFKVLAAVFLSVWDAHMTLLKNALPRDVVKPKLLRHKTTKYFEGFD